MASTTLKGIIKEIKPIEYYGEGNTGRRQTMVLFEPGYVNEYGEKKGRDHMWGIDIFNEKIDALALNNNCVDKKATVEVYLGSSEFQKKDGSGNIYIVSVNLKELKLGDRVQAKDDDGFANF